MAQLHGKVYNFNNITITRQPLLLEGCRGGCGGRGDKTVLYIGVV